MCSRSILGGRELEGAQAAGGREVKVEEIEGNPGFYAATFSTSGRTTSWRASMYQCG